MSINRVNISGNLTRDPELKATQGGTAVLNFGVAVNDRVRNQGTGEWEDRPNFVDCVVFGNRATGVQPYLSKGSKVAVEGRLRYRSWQDKQTGQNRSKLEVVVDEIEFMTARGQQPAASAPPAPQYQPQPSPAPAYAPQQPPAYQQPQQARYAPQTGYQQPTTAPTAPAAPQQPVPAAPQQTQMAVAPQQGTPAPQAPAQPGAVDVYDEDIPF